MKINLQERIINEVVLKGLYKNKKEIDEVLENLENIKDKVKLVESKQGITENEQKELLNKLNETYKDIVSRVDNLKLKEPINGVDGKDGNTPSKEDIISLIKPLIPNPVKGEKGESIKGEDGDKGDKGDDGSPDTPRDILQKIRILDDKGLQIKDINGLKEKLKLLKNLVNDLEKLYKIVMSIPVSGGTGGGSSITLQTNGVDNGSQDIFNLKQGTNVTLVDDGLGGITINATATIDTGITQLTGDITAGPGNGSQVATIADDAVTLAKMAEVATATVFYRKTAGTGNPEVQTLATLKTDLGLTGTNSGDQTSIVGITGAKAQFNTALTDGDFLFVGDVTQYTDELAQDAVGGILTDTAEIDLTYNDGTPSITADLKTTTVSAGSTVNLSVTSSSGTATYITGLEVLL